MQIALLCGWREARAAAGGKWEMGAKAGLECFRRTERREIACSYTKRERWRKEREREWFCQKAERKTTPPMIYSPFSSSSFSPQTHKTLSLNFIPSQIQEPFVTAGAGLPSPYHLTPKGGGGISVPGRRRESSDDFPEKGGDEEERSKEEAKKGQLKIKARKEPPFESPRGRLERKRNYCPQGKRME